MVKPPGSLPEGAVERSETEGVYFGERKRLKFSEPTMAYGYPLARSNQRTTLPQSRPCGRASSLREGAGRGCTTHRTARKPQDFGRFSSPLRKLRRVYVLPFNGLHSLRAGRNAPGPAVSTSGQSLRRIRSDFHLHQ